MTNEQQSNAILQCVLEGDYATGIEVFCSNVAQSAEDERWAGLCYLNLDARREARDLLSRALARGCESARIELAALYRFIGEPSLAEAVLAGLQLDGLPTLDLALAHRERAQHAMHNGDLARASHALEAAWLAASGPWPGDPLRGPIAQLQGSLYALRGQDEFAVERFELAWRLGSPARRVYALAARALSLTYLDRFAEAEQDLHAAKNGLAAVPLAQAFVMYAAATHARACGRYTQADELYEQVCTHARTTGEVETETYALLGRCAVATSRDDGRARSLLARAKRIAPDTRSRTLVSMREGALRARRGEAGACETLTITATTFGAMGLEREAGWAWLHVAEASARAGDHTAATAALERAADAQHALCGGLGVELRSLPAAQQTLQSLTTGAYARSLLKALGDTRRTVRLVTLGEHAILLDEQRVRLDFARAVEVLTYLLLNPNVRLDQVQGALFPEGTHRASKNYFHGVRRELENVLPGLRLPYDRNLRTYRVATEDVSFSWDFNELQRALNAPVKNDIIGALEAWCRGPLLPRAESQWAWEERTALQRWIVRVGLETIDTWYGQGEHGKCLSLAVRLQDIDPWDEALNESLVRAIFEVKGALTSRSVCDDICSRFEREYGQVPERLGVLRAQMTALN